MLTLGLAVLLPATALIFVNFSQLRTFERDKELQAIIHRDFQQTLAIAEKNINKKAYTMVEEARESFPSPDSDPQEREKKLDLLLSKNPWMAHAFLFDEKGAVVRSRPEQMSDKYIREEHEHLADGYRMWAKEAKTMVEGMHKKPRSINIYTNLTKRADADAYLAIAYFVLPQLSSDRVVLGGVCFDPCYLKGTLFPQALDEQVNLKLNDQGGNQLAMMIYPADAEMGHEIKPLAATAGWGEGKPEVSRNFDDVFRGLALGIKFQGTSVEAIGQSWMHRSFLILGILSLLIIGGLVLTKHVVSKEMALARLKSDFVSNVSHELRTRAHHY